MEEPKKPPIPIYRRKEFLYSAVFGALVVLLLLASRIAGRPPVVESITPRIGYPKDVMVITGRFFGKSREGGEVAVGGSRLVSGDYLEWKDNQISLRIPDDVSSGMVRVITRRGRSRGILFTNREQIPVVISGPVKAGEPYIRSIDPQSGAVGTLLGLSGMNFGQDRGGARVLFTWVSSEDDKESEGEEGSLTPALEYDQDYEAWSDQEIQVRIPDGASSGHLLVATEKGRSNSLYIEVGGVAGTKLFPLKRTYALEYSVQVRGVTGEAPNSLYLWVPKPLEGPEQRGIQLVSQEPEPMFEDVRGVKLYRLENLVPGESYAVSQSYMVDRYSVETKVNIGRVPAYDTTTKLYKRYTAADPQVPAGSEQAIKVARGVVGGERNPYRQARALYEYLISRLEPAPPAGEQDPLRPLETRKADDYSYAILFCALARAVGVPARPVAGYLLTPGQDTPVRHYWAEFYLETVGWIPVDPFLGEGRIRVSIPPEANPRSYYFGSLDFDRIAFSKGLIELNSMDPQGRAVRRTDIPSLQSVHEEAAGGLVGYSASWSGLRITGTY
jgi:transglutaminase-like putative cysteine protease